MPVLAGAACVLSLYAWWPSAPDGLQILLTAVAGCGLALYGAWSFMASAEWDLRPLLKWRNLLVLAILLHAAAFAAIAFLIPVSWTSQMGIYFNDGTMMQAGQAPYRDFLLEYPPLAAPLFWLPTLVVHDIEQYRLAFAAEMLIFDVVGAGVALWALHRFAPRTLPWGVILGQPLWIVWAGRSLIFERFDLAPAVLLLAAIVLFVGRRERWAWIILGVATAVKLYPLLVVPLFLIFAWRERPRRELLLDLGAFVAVIIGFALIVARGDLLAFSTFFTYQLDRGLEIESFYSSLLMAGHLLGDPATYVATPRMAELTAPLAPLLSALADPLTFLVIIGIYVIALGHRTARKRRSALWDVLVRLSAGVTLAFMLGGKVLSPQYLLWLYPLIAVLSTRQFTVWTLFSATLLLGNWIYPAHWSAVLSLTPAAMGVMILRNGLLLVLAVLYLAPLIRVLGVRLRSASGLSSGQMVTGRS